MGQIIALIKKLLRPRTEHVRRREIASPPPPSAPAGDSVIFVRTDSGVVVLY